MNIIEGSYTQVNSKIAIIVARFNETITDNLLKGAVDCLRMHNIDEKNIDVIKVPGAFEIPLVADKTSANKKYDAVIALGAVIRGATPHFDYVCSNASAGVMQTGLKYGKPVIFGILTTNNIEEAIERSGTKSGNKGWDSAMVALEMISLIQKLNQ